MVPAQKSPHGDGLPSLKRIRDASTRNPSTRLSGYSPAASGWAGPSAKPSTRREDEPAAPGQSDGADRNRVVARHGGPISAGGREPGMRAGGRVKGVDVPGIDVHPAKQPGGRVPDRAFGQVALAGDGDAGGQLPGHGQVTSAAEVYEVYEVVPGVAGTRDDH